MEKKLRKYIFANVLAMTGISCYVLADTFFISLAAGANGIAALNLILPIYGLIYAIGSMIGIGSATRYTLDKALKKTDANHYFSNSIFCTLLISIPFVIGGIFFSNHILILLGADTQILKVGFSYLQIVLCFTPLFMVNYTFTAFVRNDHSPNIAMMATLCSGIFNIVFDYILVFPMGLGMVGAALATALSPLVSIGICMIHYLSKRNTIVFVKKHPSLRKLADSCKLGVVAFVGEMSSGITTMVFNFILLDLSGNIAVAAYGVIANIALVGTALFNGISQGLQPVASEVHGQLDQSAEQRIYKHSLKISLLIACILVGSVLLFTDTFVAVFNSENSAELASYAIFGMRLYFLGFLLASVNIIKSGFFSAIGTGFESSVIALSRGVVSIVVLAFLLSRILDITGVWIAFPISELVTFIISVCVSKKASVNRS